MNKAIVSGTVSSYGPKISWTEAGKPQTSFTLIVQRGEYRTFVPIVVVGSNAERMAEALNPGDPVILEGALSWKAGRTKKSGRLQVVCFDVERLGTSPRDEREPPYEGGDGSEDPAMTQGTPGGPKGQWTGKKSVLRG